ncbi:tyrosine-protein phosphatase non-receptor type 23-like [Amphiura filiformis]|uniref:tyrosine-protein phosphatase non-receptor type 23-like n=1 Tax=Amphiura filiformis TaxID=82378 RepID=UPI003B2179E3
MLSGPTVLEKIWKELTDAQDRDSRQYSMAVARCYSMKNRHSDIMPYDHNRVVLTNAKNDYINASYIKDLSSTTPQFIASQAPVTSSFNDFWLMVYEQQITIIASLIAHPAVGGKNTGFDQYWLEERGQVQTYGPIMLTMQSKRNTDFHVERVFNLMHKETKQMRTLFLLQFTQWPEFGVMSNPTSLIHFIGEVNNYHKQQRNPQTPVLVHCNCGVGRTGVFCVIYTAIQEMQAGNGIINIPQVINCLRQQRKWMITEKEQLKFCYDAVLVCAQQMLAKQSALKNQLI